MFTKVNFLDLVLCRLKKDSIYSVSLGLELLSLLTVSNYLVFSSITRILVLNAQKTYLDSLYYFFLPLAVKTKNKSNYFSNNLITLSI